MKPDWLTRTEEMCVHCGGRCCIDAHPPLSARCYRRLLAEGVPPDSFEWRGYHAIRARDDGSCIFCSGNRCGIHRIKPETCQAGPFTFDVKGGIIEIFLKHEAICPVAGLLEEVPAAYEHQFTRAKQSIARLVAGLTEAELEAVCRIEEPETRKVAEIPWEYHDHRH